MNIKTKYQPKDIVFFMQDSSVRQEEIREVYIHIANGYKDPPVVSITYKFGYGTDGPRKFERDVYSSLAMLKKSIIVNKAK